MSSNFNWRRAVALAAIVAVDESCQPRALIARHRLRASFDRSSNAVREPGVHRADGEGLRLVGHYDPIELLSVEGERDDAGMREGSQLEDER